MNCKALLIAVVLAATAAPAGAAPQAVRGDQFITMMHSNTLSGTTAEGKGFNIYFLAGGIATYQQDDGTRDSGSWHLDKDGDVCVAWNDPADSRDECFRVTVDGAKVAWEGKAGGGRAALRGGVSEMFLKGMGQ